MGKYRGDNVYLSDVPEDYLNIYAQAQATFSDRVHACVGALASGRPAMFIGKTPRARLFRRLLGADTDRMTREPVSLDINTLEKERAGMAVFLKKVLL